MEAFFILFQVYAWGDNDHGQQGNGTVAVNFKPAKVLGIDGYKITRVACGSSHSIAWAELNVAPQILFDPVELKCSKDPLGMIYVTNEFEQKKTKENVGQHIRRLRSSLSKDVLHLKTNEEKQLSLTLILESLRVCYARDALIKILGDLQEISLESSDQCSGDDDATTMPSASNTDTSQIATTQNIESAKKKPGFVISRSKVKLLVSLLKLGFSGRLDESQREGLISILIYSAKRDKEVILI